MVDTTIVNIAVPTLVDTFDTTLTTVGWVNSAYLLTYAVLLLLAGRLGDRYGPKPVFVLGLVVFTLASLWCGLSGSVEMLIVARAVQGVGAALMTPQTMSMITRVFPPRQRGAAMGLWGAVAGVATIAARCSVACSSRHGAGSGSSSSTSPWASWPSSWRCGRSRPCRPTSAASTWSGSRSRSWVSSSSCLACRRARRTTGARSWAR
ncbi:MFS transporter [Oerskovia sp. M15]